MVTGLTTGFLAFFIFILGVFFVLRRFVDLDHLTSIVVKRI